LEAELHTQKKAFAAQKKQAEKVVEFLQDFQEERERLSTLVKDLQTRREEERRFNLELQESFDNRWQNQEHRMADLNDYNLNVSSILLSLNDWLTYH
jgi:hypothetical protein